MMKQVSIVIEMIDGWDYERKHDQQDDHRRVVVEMKERMMRKEMIEERR